MFRSKGAPTRAKIVKQKENIEVKSCFDSADICYMEKIAIATCVTSYIKKIQNKVLLVSQSI
jgi:hypothetical protein